MSDQKQTPPQSGDEIETRPDGWNRFRRAVNAAIKSGPKHRPAQKSKDQSAIKKGRNAKR